MRRAGYEAPRLSVCLSHTGIASKQLNGSTWLYLNSIGSNPQEIERMEFEYYQHRANPRLMLHCPVTLVIRETPVIWALFFAAPSLTPNMTLFF